MKILTFSSLFPNAAAPHHGVFVENRLRHLVASGRVESRVVAPVPWVPPGLARGRYAAVAQAPARERRGGIEIVHPRYPTIPRIGMTVAPYLMYLATRPAVRQVIADGFDFDLIDAHYFYPDGVCAALLARHFDRPFVITGRGTDLTLIPRYALPRRMIQWAARRSGGLITVCQSLKDDLEALGVPPSHVRVLRNGVDLAMFRPADRAAARQRYGVDGTVLVSVGYLIPRKAHDLLIRAATLLPDVTVLIAGEGPEQPMLESLIREHGLQSRVRLLGRQPHESLATLYSAADIMVLASSREGWANVLLESMACGTPVVASAVDGTPEVVAAPAAGRLMEARTPEAIAAAVRDLLAAGIDRAATRTYAEQFDWNETTAGQIALFEAVLAAHRTSCPARAPV